MAELEKRVQALEERQEQPLTDAHERAMRIKCMIFLKQFGIALAMYADDFNEVFPPDLRFLYDRYITDTELFACPSGEATKALHASVADVFKNRPADVPAKNVSYCYVAGLKMTDPADYVLAFDEEGNHRGAGVNVLYVGQDLIWLTDLGAVRAQLKKQEEALKAQGREMKIIRPSEEIKKAQP